MAQEELAIIDKKELSEKINSIVELYRDKVIQLKEDDILKLFRKEFLIVQDVTERNVSARVAEQIVGFVDKINYSSNTFRKDMESNMISSFKKYINKTDDRIDQVLVLMKDQATIIEKIGYLMKCITKRIASIEEKTKLKTKTNGSNRKTNNRKPGKNILSKRGRKK